MTRRVTPDADPAGLIEGVVARASAQALDEEYRPLAQLALDLVRAAQDDGVPLHLHQYVFAGLMLGSLMATELPDYTLPRVRAYFTRWPQQREHYARLLERLCPQPV